MFRRKKEDGEEMKPDSVPPAGAPEEETVDLTTPTPRPMPRPMTPSPGTVGVGAAFGKPASPIIGRGGVTWGARDRGPGEAPAESKKLIVGREIVLSGQITSSERLIVEGRVEASLTESRIIEIAETGHFKGSAEIESADIGGRFEGTLTVRERLFIRSTGKVSGKITYGQIEIEPGGEIAGEVHVGPRRTSGESE